MEYTDTEMLDWLQSKTKKHNDGWCCEAGGTSLHTCIDYDSYDVRVAITDAIDKDSVVG